MNKYIYMTRDMMFFDEKDAKKLSLWLGVDLKKKIVYFYIISLMLSLIVSIVSLIAFDKDITIIALIIGMILPLFIYIRNYNNRYIKYMEAVNEVYDNILKEYEGYYKFHCLITTNASNKFRTNESLFITNGYRFVIFEDPFKSTNIKYKNKNIKVCSDLISTLQSFSFKLTDILEYSKPNNIVDNDFIDNINSNQNYDKFKITLKDFSIIELSSNIYPFIKENLPLKEKIYEK